MKTLVISVASLAVVGLGLVAATHAPRPWNVESRPGQETASALVSTPAAIPTTESAQSEPQATLAQAVGQFVTVEQDHPTTGIARIVTENGQRYLEFDADFDTARGPDVNVVLYGESMVPVNLGESDYLTLASLQSFSGAQRYLIPAEGDLAAYQAVGIWCRQFDVTFGYATL
jgi:hypothetical protein